jgi:acyl-coenzyme A synthetase/AMP-(fatty) acid ligase
MADSYNRENFKDIFERSFTWVNGFMRCVRRYADKTAVTDPLCGKSWTYGELNAEVNRFANAMRAAGVKPGDIVFYQLYNSEPFVLCYIAPQKLGAVNAPGNFNLSAGETARMLDRDRPAVYVYDCDVKDMAARALEICAVKPRVVLAVNYRGLRPQLPAGHLFFDDFIRSAPASEPETDFTPDMYAEVTRFCTSGTTGTPKGVPLNAVNEVLSAHDSIMHFPLTPYDVTMNMTPWFHRGGLHSGGINPTLYCGASLVVLRMFSAKTCFDYVQKYSITYLIGVPSALKALADRQEKHPSDLSALRGIVTMGSPLERDACIRYQKLLTPRIFNGYGTTETFWNSFLRPEDLPEAAGSAGGACTGDEVRVVKMLETGRAEPEDTVATDGVTEGEIIIFSPEKSGLSYVCDEPLAAEKYYKGWFYTHDVGVWDAKRYITVRGRRDDMIICMGENIYPAQLEEVLSRHPKVRDCMVTGVADKARGEAVAAYIIAEDDSLTAKELQRYCAASDDIAAYMRPRYYRFVPELPYNSTGKKQHVLLRERAREELEKGLLILP